MLIMNFKPIILKIVADSVCPIFNPTGFGKYILGSPEARAIGAVVKGSGKIGGGIKKVGTSDEATTVSSGRDVIVEGAGNGGTSITAHVTDVDFTEDMFIIIVFAQSFTILLEDKHFPFPEQCIRRKKNVLPTLICL